MIKHEFPSSFLLPFPSTETATATFTTFEVQVPTLI